MSVTPLLDATEAAIKAATHLTRQDAGAVEALRALARKIDTWDQIVQYALDDLRDAPKGARPSVPQNDNVSISAYLKGCEQLGLSPSGRKTLDIGEKESAGGKLAQLRSVQGKRGA